MEVADSMGARGCMVRAHMMDRRESPSNRPLERPGISPWRDSNRVSAGRSAPIRSPHSYFGEATCGGEFRAGRRALLFTLKKLRGRT
jgi:hypothetical protein